MRSVVILALAMTLVGCSVQATEAPHVAPATDPTRLTGTVLETMDASNYTYLRLETSDGEAWAAVPRVRLEVGAGVSIANPQTMSGFESKTLGRTFDTIHFGTLAGRGADSRHGAPIASTGSIEVEPAGGATGRTIAEVYDTRAALAGQVVAVRGRVVKYNEGIMDRNWVHLQDGTGDPSAGTHDITVTTPATTAVGDVVLIEGTVAVDRDFGAGYRYEVIVEEASLAVFPGK